MQSADIICISHHQDPTKRSMGPNFPWFSIDAFPHSVWK